MTEEDNQISAGVKRYECYSKRTRYLSGGTLVGVTLSAFVFVSSPSSSIPVAGALCSLIIALSAIWFRRKRNATRESLLTDVSATSENSIASGRQAIGNGDYGLAVEHFREARSSCESVSQIAKSNFNRDEGNEPGTVGSNYALSRRYLSSLEALAQSGRTLPEAELDGAEKALQSSDTPTALRKLSNAGDVLSEGSSYSRAAAAQEVPSSIRRYIPKTGDRATEHAHYDPFGLAELSVKGVASRLDISADDAKELRQRCRNVTTDSGYLLRLTVDRSSFEAQRRRWNRLAERAVDHGVSEIAETIAERATAIPVDSQTPEEFVRESIEVEFSELRRMTLDRIEPVDQLRKLSTKEEWVDLELGSLDGSELSTGIDTGPTNTLSLAFDSLDNLSRRYDCSVTAATELRETAVHRLHSERTLEELGEAVQTYMDAYDRIVRIARNGRRWVELTRQIQTSLETPTELTEETVIEARRHHQTASNRLDELDSIHRNEPFHDAVRQPFAAKRMALSRQLERRIREVRVWERRAAFEDAEALVDGAISAIDTGAIEEAEANLNRAESIISGTTYVIDEDRRQSLSKRITAGRSRLAMQRIEVNLADISTELDSASSHLENDDLESAEEILTRYPERFRTVDGRLSIASLDEAQRRDGVAKLTSLRETVSGLTEQVETQKERRAIESVRERIGDAKRATETEEYERATRLANEAMGALSSVSIAILRDEALTVREEVEGVYRDAVEMRIHELLRESQHELNRANGYLLHDADESRAHVEQSEQLVETAKSVIESEELPDLLYTELSEEIAGVNDQIRAATERIEEREVTVAVEELQDAIDSAHDAVETGSYAASTGHLRTASYLLGILPEQTPKADKLELRSAINDVKRRRRMHREVIRPLEEVEYELQRAWTAVESDIEIARRRLNVVRSILDAAARSHESLPVSKDRAADFSDQLKEYRVETEELEKACTKREITRATDAVSEYIDEANELIQTSDFDRARVALHSGESELNALPAEVPAEKEEALRSKLQGATHSLVINRDIRPALDTANSELQRSRGYLNHDLAETRDRLAAARAALDSVEVALASFPSIDTVEEDYRAEVSRYREQIETMEASCQNREVELAVERTRELIDAANAALQSREFEEATDLVDSGYEAFTDLPDAASTEIREAIQNDIDDVNRSLTQRDIAEEITSAESLVENAETARESGDSETAIEEYQRAIKAYESVLSDAQEHELGEAYEIARRISQLGDLINATEERWVTSQTTKIDREIRAGERAVSAGLEAASTGDPQTARDEYELAVEAADAARTWLKDLDSEGGLLAVSSATLDEYRSATNSLTGHLGYLKSEIQDAEAMSELAVTPTPLAEYYDGLYTLYKALPESVHPVWNEALSTALFGGEGLADGAEGYASQHADRNEFAVSTLREQNGDGDAVRQFHCVDVAEPRNSDRGFFAEGQLIPVAPESESILPVDVSPSNVIDAVELLNEFPAYPVANAAKDRGHNLLNVEYFREKLHQEDRDVEPSASAMGEAETDSVSSELADLQRELDEQIGNL